VPYPSEHAARVKNPDDFEKDSFRRKDIAPGIAIIIGKEKNGNGSMVTQAYRFEKTKFTEAEAKKWLEDHKVKYISFEPATSNVNEKLTTNTARKEIENEKEYLVVPGVILQEQVMNDYFVPEDEIVKSYKAWNGRPVVIYHPKKNEGSANVPPTERDVVEIGRFYNAKWDQTTKQVTGEYWIEVAEADKFIEGKDVLNAIHANKILETSTGYFAFEDMTGGTFKERPYRLVHRDLQPDHIAILPGKVGACSIKDGCGCNRNEVTEDCMTNCPFIANVLSTARHPTYSGTETTSWDGVTKTIEAYVAGYEKAHKVKDVPRKVADLPSAVKTWIASKTLLGDPKADNERDLTMFPVVNPGTDNLNAGALRAVLSGRGSAAQISASARDSAQNMARNLLEKEFHKEAGMKKNDFVQWLKDKLHLEVKVNEATGEQEETFEILKEPLAATPTPAQFTENEATALKSLAGSATAILAALKDIPKAIALAQNAETQANARKTEMVALIKANQSNQLTEEELKTLTLPVLEKMNAQLNIDYTGAGGAGRVIEKGKGLEVKPVLLAKPAGGAS
jgi:hypothetical protein